VPRDPSLALGATKKGLGATFPIVIPRHASAEGPLASLGATKKGLGATKKEARGDKEKTARSDKKKLGATAGGLAPKHF